MRVFKIHAFILSYVLKLNVAFFFIKQSQKDCKLVLDKVWSADQC